MFAVACMLQLYITSRVQPLQQLEQARWVTRVLPKCRVHLGQCGMPECCLLMLLSNHPAAAFAGAHQVAGCMMLLRPHVHQCSIKVACMLN
jgi:hypothetical protein